ncbi:RsmE family RNA methyltransferase [Ilumatobacter coccineus]|uniref:Ribosomal RNA small subunit methyltransferase E n=1 Tax=Ilumatobacter coccineus (strain NBRC 103263 / KCTC 29153 / YM16-304) TaxID=1313172 RepID=A0A6C7E6M8_ILUCY|nr:RsmE family RNA methyltransferase [Ilumatobacter coccineus]BAN02427.1 putative ribosomal RNA small subunit methyltransferase [Ilumatobacter coccineus YM16-304]
MPATELPDELRRSSTHVLVADPADLDTGGLVLEPDVEHHLVRVLRLTSGESVTATDGVGGWREYTAVVDHGSVLLEPASERHQVERGQRRLTIATAIPKGDRVDWLVQKCTELGADRIVLLHAERSVVRWKPARAAKQLDRLQRIADEALRQSRRVWRVAVDGPVDAVDILPDAVVAEPGGRPLTAADSTIAIGPEGGWSADELAAASDEISLGTGILRTETAAISATILSQ